MTREEAIEVLSSYDVNGVWADVDGKPYNAEEQAEAFDMAIEALRATKGWIPCSEKLPSKRQSVLISTRECFVGEGCYWETTEHHVIWKGYRWNATYWDDEVVAWMPMPYPYTADRKTEQTERSEVW